MLISLIVTVRRRPFVRFRQNCIKESFRNDVMQRGGEWGSFCDTSTQALGHKSVTEWEGGS